MDKEQVGLKVWFSKSAPLAITTAQPALDDMWQEGVAMTTQQRDDLTAERYTAGATDMEWQAATVMRTTRIPRSAEDVRNRIKRFRDQLRAITGGQSQAYTDKIRRDTLKEVDKALEKRSRTTFNQFLRGLLAAREVVRALKP